MRERRRGSPGWKIFAAFVALFATLAIAFFFWVRGAVERKREALEAKVRDLQARVEAVPPERPPLRGRAVPGNAWDEYAKAVAVIRGFNPPTMIFGEFYDRTPQADRGAVVKALEKYGAALDHLADGARRSGAQYPYVWEDGFGGKTPGLLFNNRLAQMGVCKARLLAEEGRVAEAVPILLDVAQFGRDLSHNGFVITEMVGIAILSYPIEELRDLALSGKLEGEGLQTAVEGLRRLDENFTREDHVLRAEALGFAYTVMKDGAEGAWWGLGSWRYGFSAELESLDGILRHVESLERCAEASRGTWQEQADAVEGEKREARESPNRLLDLIGMFFLPSSRALREKRVHLRLVRTLLETLATGTAPELDDPFGTALRTSETDGVLRVWSVGSNGTDEGGKGGWLRKEGPDIVIEMKR